MTADNQLKAERRVHAATILDLRQQLEAACQRLTHLESIDVGDRKTLAEARIIARSSDPEWLGDELYRLQEIAAQSDSLRQQLEAAQLEMAGAVADRNARILYLEGLINTPHTDDFVRALQLEAAHQIELWGVEHDAGKRPEDWISLVVYLLGKATKAHYDSDAEKLKHHIITVAAVGLNWFRALTGDSNVMRPGVGPLEDPTDG